MTIGDVIELEQNQENMYDNSELKSQWDSWPEVNSPNHLNCQVARTDLDSESQINQAEDENQEDFFKDMVPQIRKQKKILVRNNISDEQETCPPNRLGMDPSGILISSELGVIDDNPSNWEDSENSEQLWDPDALIREKKRAEQEKRRAEHQRRKLEKENRRSSKPESLSSIMLSLSESKDKHKYS